MAHPPGTQVLAAEIELSLVAAKATQGRQTRLRFLDLQQHLRLFDSDRIAEEVGRGQRPAVIDLHDVPGRFDMQRYTWKR